MGILITLGETGESAEMADSRGTLTMNRLAHHTADPDADLV